MHPQSTNQDDANVPIWPSMDSIMPTNVDSAAPGSPPAGTNGYQANAPSQQESRLRVANPPAQPVYDDRIPGAPPLPVAAPTPVPSNVPAPHTGAVAVRPGERAAALAAKTHAEPPAPDVPGGSWNQPNALVRSNADVLDANAEPSASINQAKLVSMPTLNKVKLPDPTSIVKTLTTPVRNPTGLVEEAGEVEGELPPAVTKEQILAASKPATQPVETKQIAKKTAPVAAAPSPDDSSHQLALQIIFGFEEVLNREEVLDLAKGLDGVKKIKLVGGSEAAAFQLLKESAREYEYADKEDGVSLRSGDHNLEFIGDERLCLCIVLDKPALPKASREKLTLIAREAARLSE